jgi:serine/threonine-protein kinase RsbW
LPETQELAALTIQSDPVRFREARMWIAGIARRSGFDEADAHDLALALNEACANAHAHAYLGRTDGRIDLHVEAGSDRVRLTVRDYGIPFDRKAYAPPELTQAREGGYGVYLISKLMDHVEYKNTGVGTCVVMDKRRGSGSR